MSFLADPPMLVATGAAVERLVPDRRARAAIEAGTVALFVGFSVGLYLEKPWATWLSRLVGARSGRDWMLNSRVTDFEYESPSVLTHLVSGAIFATYPGWYRLGRRLGRAGTVSPATGPTPAQ